MRFATKALRVGQDPDSTFRAVVPPIYQSSTFAWEDLDHIPPIDYSRCQNPTREALEKVVASLENGSCCTLFSSGMAAVAATFALLQQGDHFLVASDIYGGTFRLAEKYLPRQGVSYSSFDAQNPETIRELIQPTTKLLIFEGPTNPTMRVPDIKKVADIAHEYGLTVVFDNTFASPALQTPLDLGVDIVLHSTTKYISGHSDVVGGATITNDRELADFIFEWNKAFGCNPSPFDNWLSLRGVRTLKCRMKEHCANAQLVAEYLETVPTVTAVHYPGLPSHPDHEVAKKQMRGFGGMVSVEFSSVEEAKWVAEHVSVFLLAESLGGVESLIAYPPLMSHATMTEEQRLERGIPPTMLRLSIGIEDAEDLIDDLRQAVASFPRVAVSV
ncbi:MAG TPA: PLP-dependent aspartate aminotransferase family protein [Fimbriimonas sp.]|nr:PLP-dependent aspartate aminotransferase family protein [Fimbriimonas sp.]